MKASKEVREYLRQIGKKGGSATTPKKQQASRENGRRGGRPGKKDNGPK